MLDAHELLRAVTGTREVNRKKLIIEIMVKSDRQSRIARRLNLSPASVSTSVQELVEAGIVDGEKDLSRGRGRGGDVRLRQTRGVAVGVHIGFHRTVVIARRVDALSSAVSRQSRDDGAGRGLRQIVPIVVQMIRDVVDETGHQVTDVVSAGIAVPRMIDPRTERFAAPVLPPWEDGDEPRKEFEKQLGVRVAIDNDANLGAMAEQTYGLDEPIETVVYVKASTGVGAGIMIGDRLLRGHRGMAGELGHLSMTRHGEVCPCGGRGCLDTIVGAEALLAQARAARRGTAYHFPVTLSALIESARAGDSVCARILDDAGRTLGSALAQLCNLINPRLVVLGGELSAAGELVLDPCRHELRRTALPGAVNPAEDFVLRLSELDGLSEAQGALILGLRHRQLEPSAAPTL